MKRILHLTFSLLIGTMLSAQTARDVVVLNELYTDPKSTTHEFMELYNSSLKEIDMDEYTIISYFEFGGTTGFYVMDLPHYNLSRNSFFVSAPVSPFNAQANVSTNPHFAWSTYAGSDAYIKKFVLSGGVFSEVIMPDLEMLDIMNRKQGGGAQFQVLVYDGEDLVNFFVGGASSMPASITSLPNLTIPFLRNGQAPSTKTLIFSGLTANKAESVTPTTGSDNGYRRNRNGQCGTWVKSASGADHTPNLSNGSTSNTGSLTVTATLGQAGSNVNALNLGYRISATSDPNIWPVTVRVVNDYSTVLDDQGTSTVKENLLPEGPFVSYNDPDLEEAVNTGSPDLSYTYPIPPVTNIMSSAISYLTSPVFTPGLYTGFTGEKTARAFHVFFQAASGCIDQVQYAQVTNAPVLPVNFKSFTAKRNKQQVHLNWQTASECSNAGFVIERNINGQWSEAGFVATKAPGGTSDVTLDYQFIDQNNHKGITQYRIRQNDFNDKTTYSTVRSVQGDGAGPKMVIYPNPSFDGRVQIVFEDAGSSRHVVVSDMNGRIVRQMNNVNSSSVVVDGLNAGLYTARVINQATGESTLQKFVIQQK
jgi:hypothetical protein